MVSAPLHYEMVNRQLEELQLPAMSNHLQIYNDTSDLHILHCVCTARMRVLVIAWVLKFFWRLETLFKAQMSQCNVSQIAKRGLQFRIFQPISRIFIRTHPYGLYHL